MKINIEKLNQIIEGLKEDLGEAFVATDIWATKNAQSLAGYNTQPKAVALFNEVTRALNKTLKGAEFPGLGSYYMLHLENNQLFVLVVLGEFQEGILVDLAKTTMGVLMNVALPRLLNGLREATQ